MGILEWCLGMEMAVGGCAFEVDVNVDVAVDGLGRWYPYLSIGMGCRAGGGGRSAWKRQVRGRA